MALIGMDVDQVSQSANQINSQSGQLQTLITQLTSTVNNLSSIWVGTDATTFVSTTWPTHKSNLDKCKADLDTLVTQLKQEIQQQTQTSAS